MLMMQLLHKNCTPQNIAKLIINSGLICAFDAKSLEECLPQKAPLVNFIKQIAKMHLDERFFGGGYCLKDEWGNALCKICDFSFNESADNIKEKITYLMKGILGIEGESYGSGAQNDSVAFLPKGVEEFCDLIPQSGSSIDKKSQTYGLKMNLIGMNFSYCNFVNMDLTGMHFFRVDLSHADLSGANLQDVSFIGSDLTGVTLNDVRNWSDNTFIYVDRLSEAKTACNKLKLELRSQQSKAIMRTTGGALANVQRAKEGLLERQIRRNLAEPEEGCALF